MRLLASIHTTVGTINERATAAGLPTLPQPRFHPYTLCLFVDYRLFVLIVQ
jgi:hypothetical protein